MIAYPPNPPEVHPDWCARHLCEAPPNAASHATARIERGEATAQVVQWVEWVGAPDGPVLDEPLGVLAVMKGEQIDDGRLMSAADCRDVAAVLLRAANQLESISRS